MKRVFILTGAGISAESGVPTFRDAGGLWEGHRIEEVATPEAFKRNPHLVHRFYNLRREAVQKCEPNEAHRALAKLQNAFPGKITLVTQNVDDLHERGGCSEVLHMHGQLLKVRCSHCENQIHFTGSLGVTVECQQCTRVGDLRPDIVWFGEIPYFQNEINRALEHCDLFVAVGTSGVVYPAAGYVQIANDQGIPSIEFNLQQTEISGHFTENRFGPATQTVSNWVQEVLLAH